MRFCLHPFLHSYMHACSHEGRHSLTRLFSSTVHELNIRCGGGGEMTSSWVRCWNNRWALVIGISLTHSSVPSRVTLNPSAWREERRLSRVKKKSLAVHRKWQTQYSNPIPFLPQTPASHLSLRQSYFNLHFLLWLYLPEPKRIPRGDRNVQKAIAGLSLGFPLSAGFWEGCVVAPSLNSANPSRSYSNNPKVLWKFQSKS